MKLPLAKVIFLNVEKEKAISEEIKTEEPKEVELLIKEEEKEIQKEDLPKKEYPPHSFLLYKVKNGDSLVSIIIQFPGLSLKELKAHNKGLNAQTLIEGKEIKIIQYD